MLVNIGKHDKIGIITLSVASLVISKPNQRNIYSSHLFLAFSNFVILLHNVFPPYDSCFYATQWVYYRCKLFFVVLSTGMIQFVETNYLCQQNTMIAKYSFH